LYRATRRASTNLSSPSQRLSLRGRNPSGAEPEPEAERTVRPFDRSTGSRLRAKGLSECPELSRRKGSPRTEKVNDFNTNSVHPESRAARDRRVFLASVQQAIERKKIIWPILTIDLQMITY